MEMNRSTFQSIDDTRLIDMIVMVGASRFSGDVYWRHIHQQLQVCMPTHTHTQIYTHTPYLRNVIYSDAIV